MRKLDRSKKYNLEHLTPEQLGQLFDKLSQQDPTWDNKEYFVENQCKRYDIGGGDFEWRLVPKDTRSTDARELFNGWYETDDSMNEEWLVYIDYTKNIIWGFNWEGVWFKRDYEEDETNIENYFAKKEDVFERLTEEAERRGYKGKFTFDLNELMCDGVTILKDGEWGEVIKSLDDKNDVYTAGNGMTFYPNDTNNLYIIGFDPYKELTTYFYHNSEKYGANFYELIKEIQTKVDSVWKTFVIYKQLGSGLEFSREKEEFYSKFKQVHV